MTIGWCLTAWAIASVLGYGFVYCCFAVGSEPVHEHGENYQRGTNPERAQDGNTAQIIQFVHH